MRLLRVSYSLLTCVSLAILPLMLHAQNVVVSGAVVGNGSYTTLGAAFAAINGGGQGGANIVIDIVANTNEASVAAVLNESVAPWTSLSIRPQGGSFTVTGTVAGTGLIDLNGADNVTIDGLNTSGNALTIANTSTSTTGGTATIRLIGGACNNTITRTTLRGASRAASAATVLFGTGSGSTGNNNNTLSQSVLEPNGTQTPQVAIGARGSTAAALYNTGNQILDNQVRDYHASGGASWGLLSDGYCTQWTITGNRFFQTSSRNVTFSHGAIRLNTNNGNAGCTISNNVIGYANAGGTGAYSLTGGGSTAYFSGIYIESQSSGSTPNTLLNNTVAGITLQGSWATAAAPSAAFMGIYLNSSNAASAATVTGNMVGSATVTSSINLNATAIQAGLLYLEGTSTIAQNTVGGVNLTSGGAMTGITASGSNGVVHQNTVGTSTAPLVGGSGQLIGIKVFTGTVTQNQVSYLSNASSTSGTGANAYLIGILQNNTASGPAMVCEGNVVHTLANTNTTGFTTVAGIVSAASNLRQDRLDRNHVGTLVVASAFAKVHGMSIGTGSALVSNNMVRIGYNQSAASITQGAEMTGIHEAGGGSDLYFNSVYIGGTGVTGVNGSICYNSTSAVLSGPRVCRNNIFFNARSNGSNTASHAAIRFANAGSISCDYNDLYAPGNGGIVGIQAGNWATLAHWQMATSLDTNSYSTDPNFMNPTGTGTTGDLHLQPSNTMEGVGGAYPSVTVDFDGQSRASLTPVDIGADAGNFSLLDVVAPTFSYTPSSFYCASGDLTFSATITDNYGVPTVGPDVPRVYYRKNGGAYFSAPGTLVSGNGLTGTWSFAILAANVGGWVSGDFMQYFVVAQDVAGPNVGGSPAVGLSGTSVHNVTSPPNDTYTYGQLAGTYTVGTTGFFTTLTGAVNAYNSNCLGGPVLFSLIDANYPDEVIPITFNAHPQASSVRTLTVKPAAGVTATISSVNAPMLQFFGADYVTLDGSNGNVQNSVCPRDTATRDLNLFTTSTNYAGILLCKDMAGDPVTNVHLANCNIRAPYGIQLLGQMLGGALGTVGNNDNQFANNFIVASSHGIDAQGMPSLKNVGNRYLLNRIVAQSGGPMVGIMVGDEDSAVVHANILDVYYASVGPGLVSAINLGRLGQLTETSAAGSEVTNASVMYNHIRRAFIDNYGCSAAGIIVAATSSGTTTIANNMIGQVMAPSFAPSITAGIFYGGGAGQMRIYHNTINMGVASGYIAVQPCQASMGIAIAGATPPVDIRNNVISVVPVNYMSESRGISLGYTGTLGAYQNLVSGPNNVRATRFGTTGSLGGAATNHTTQAAWNTETGVDPTSTTIVPNWVVPNSDWHLTAQANPTLDNLGDPLAAITDDFDCEPRSLAHPDLGADENTDACTSALAGAIADSDTICAGSNIVLTGSGYSTQYGISYQWQSSPSGQNTWSNMPSSNPATVAVSPATDTDYRLEVTCSLASVASHTNIVTITVLPAYSPAVAISPLSTGPYCPGQPVALVATQGNGGSAPAFQWTLDGSPVGTNNDTLQLLAPQGGGTVQCLLRSNLTCALPDSVWSNTVALVGDTVAPTALCQSVSVQLDANGRAVVAPATVDAGSSDNCGIASMALSLDSLDCSHAGTQALTLTVTDASGNSAICNTTLTVLTPAFSLSLQADTLTCGYAVSCAGAQDGVAHAQVQSPCGGQTYAWSTGHTTPSVTQLPIGWVSVTVTDPGGQVQVDSILLDGPMPLSLQLDSLQSTCTGDSTGVIAIQAAGGNDCAPYGFLWSNGATTEDIAGLPAGSYAVTVTDAQGCTASQAYSVAGIAPTAPALSLQDSTLSTPDIWAAYQWILNGVPIPGAAADTLLAVVSGVYSLQVTDSNGCSAVSDTLTVNLVGVVGRWGVGCSVHPVPSSGRIWLEAAEPLSVPLQLQLIDSKGLVVMARSLPSLDNREEMDLDGLPAGMYKLRVLLSDGRMQVLSVVKQ